MAVGGSGCGSECELGKGMSEPVEERGRGGRNLKPVEERERER
jgi:hypothetical protein